VGVNWRSKALEAEERSMEARAAVKRVEAREAGLTRRRATLRERLAREAEAHAAEMAGTRASAEAKRAQLEARARELLAKREEEREKHAEEMEYRKFLESDEGAQREMREKLAREVEFGRRMQVKERRRLDQEAEEQTKQLNAVISRRFMEDSARMDDREAASKASREAHVRALREQMAACESNRMKYLEEERAERARLNAQWSEELLLDTRAKDEEVMEQRRMHAELLTANRERYSEQIQTRERERERDRELVERAMEQERIVEEDRIQSAQRRIEEEEALYRKYREDLLRRTAQEELDDARIEEDRLKYDKKMRAREMAEEIKRKKLMEEVREGRARQIAEREAKRCAAKAEDMEWQRKNQEDMDLAQRQLDEKLRIATQANLKYRASLEEQIRRNREVAPESVEVSSRSDLGTDRNDRFVRRFAQESQNQTKTTSIYSF